MAVHFPLSAEAQAEARILMLSANNILSPATGRPITVPTQDMVFGCYYLTLEVPGAKGEGRVFRNLYEVEQAFESRDIALHAKITLRTPRETDNGDGPNAVLETTAGRLFFNEALPDDFPYVNDVIGKKNIPIGQIVEDLAENYPKVHVAASLDRIKDLGFRYGAQSGLTISID